MDDEQAIRVTMRRILENQGYQVKTAATGQEAIKKTNKQKFNLMLIDIRLPDFEGIELLDRLREDLQRTRKIIITGYPTLQNAIDSVNKKADAYLLKPVDPDHLLAIISEQLSLQQEENSFSEGKVAEFIDSRSREYSSNQRLLSLL